MKWERGMKIRHRHRNEVLIVEGWHEPSQRVWARKNEEGSAPITYEWLDEEVWEIVRPFFEEGKTYEHKRLPGRTFKVETVRDGVAFGLLTPTDGSPSSWTCRRRDDFQMWHERPEQ